MGQCIMNKFTSNANKQISKIRYKRADITELDVEVIVNASNTSGLGCFIPNHCVDSAIHAAAGPELFLACQKFTNGIPTGHAEITPGFNLCAKWIIHVTGPEYSEEEKTLGIPLDFATLANCYKKCLDVCEHQKWKQIAFPCISTGIFGFPKEESAEVAVNAVKNWLICNPNNHIQDVIFVAFDYADQEIFASLL